MTARFVTLLATFFCTVSFTFAQTGITGKVYSQIDSQPIAGALVCLLSPDSTTIAQTQTDVKGKFTLQTNSSIDKNIVTAAFVGYTTESITIFNADNGTIDLGNIFLSEAQDVMLNEVTVTANKVLQKADKYIVIPQSDEVSRASRAIDLLEQIPLPGLSVDRVLNSITVSNGAPMLMVNGKERDKNYFSNINPEKILRIEYNNTPGIRYIDRGAAGIINIVLKETDEGGSVTAQLQSALTTGFVNGYFNGSYNYGKSQFSLMYSCGYRDYDKWLANSNEKFIGGNHYIERIQRGIDSPMYYFDNNITADYTYMHNPNTMLVVNFNSNFCPASGGNDGHITEIKDGVNWEYDRVQRRKSNAYNPTLDVFFSKKMTGGHSLELNAVANMSNGYSKRTLTYLYDDAANNQEIPYETDNDGWSLAAEAAYGKQFTNITTRFGIQYLHNYAENKYKASDSFSKMKKDNTYVYGEVNGKIGKVAYNLGTGLKILNVDDYTDSRTFMRNLTTATLQYKAGEHWNLRYNFSYSPSLPSLSQLSPIISQTDDISYSTGNPSLKPSELIANSVNAFFQSGKFSADISAGYNHRFNPINATTIYDAKHDYFLFTRENGKYYYNAFGRIQLALKRLFNHLNIIVTTRYSSYQTKGNGYKHNLDNFSGHVTLQAYFGDWTFGAGQSFATQKYLSGTTIGSYENQSYIYAQYKYRNFYFGATVLCPFQKDGFKYETEFLSSVNPGYSVNWTKDNGNMFELSVTYQANFGKSFKKNRKTLNNKSYDNGMVQ